MDEQEGKHLWRIVRLHEFSHFSNAAKILCFVALILLITHELGYTRKSLVLYLPAAFIFIILVTTYVKTETYLKKNEKDPYHPEIGSKRTWYDLNYEFNKKIKWTERVDALLKLSGIHLIEKEVVLSPSGNKGKYEKNLSKKYPNTTFYATDFSLLSNHETSEGNFIYLNQSNDAFHISAYTKQYDIKKIDVIWDIKGVIWYQAQNIDDLTALLTEYYSVLSDNGIIVIDAYKFNIFKNVLSELINSKKTRYYYHEESTYSRIRDNLNDEILQMFDIRLLEDGLCSIAVLSKKPKASNLHASEAI
ncbi:hypothetical protein [Paenibacillus bovis]|uniref:Methyltransferase n=1 Tax=Paenibacillus bovis TaxID=1616788 RepID=A0A1X9T4K4_9BACL|nr:hypothetical protein [Paenibacillus bovis]ARR10762.1 hypothetical protein AR543_p0154 [Paenibacillus bovis]